MKKAFILLIISTGLAACGESPEDAEAKKMAVLQAEKAQIKEVCKVLQARVDALNKEYGRWNDVPKGEKQKISDERPNGCTLIGDEDRF